ncbi:MAG: methyltransferase domain-containing protein [Ignavibacteriales bacterium]|nr:methyltransferase domain-containing protein [Ignavibacteriales bacterium]
MSPIDELQRASVEKAFDSVAETFERTLENDATRQFRNEVYAEIETLVPRGSSVLDINCGIGVDALTLAEKGFNVVGVDIAAKMIEVARQRSTKLRFNTAEFLVGSFEDLSGLSGCTFDLVLSNFGGLNCVPSLQIAGAQIAAITRQSGFFIATVMPPLCLWEVLAGMARMDFKSAFRRLHTSVMATGFPGGTFAVSYYSPHKFAATMRQWFEVKLIRGFNVFSPPPHATRFRTSHPLFSQFLADIDKRAARLPLARSMGDHYLMVLKRRDQ